MTDSNKHIKEVQKDVDETKKIMENNVEQLIRRAELLEELDIKSKDLRHQTQEFSLNSNTLKTALQTKNYVYAGIISFGIAGSLYGAVSGYSPVSCLMTGLLGSGVGGTLGYFSGTIKAYVGRLMFAYQLQDNPFKALKNKFSSGLQEKLKPNNTSSLTQETPESNNKKSSSYQSHHEVEEKSLEISKTLTQWFEAKKQEKKEVIEHKPSQKNRTNLKPD